MTKNNWLNNTPFKLDYSIRISRAMISYPSHLSISVGITAYVKVFVPPEKFSKFINIWLWNFSYLFTIMPPTCKQEGVTLAFFLLRIYVKACVPSQIFSKSIYIWFWNFAHLFTIMLPTFRQEKFNISFWLLTKCP
jgi:hypothetical protein